jgi:hypothetical protein
MVTGACQVPDDERKAISIELPASQAAVALLFAPSETERLCTVVMKLFVTEKKVVWELHAPPTERCAVCTR